MSDEITNEQNGKTGDVLPMEQPEFHHGRVSYKKGSEFNKLNRQLTQINMLLATEAKEDATPEDRLRVETAKSEAMEEVDDLIIERDQFFDLIVKSIPRSWLIDDAPKKINDGEWLQWVRRDRFGEVGECYQATGVRKREETKN